MPIRRPRRRGSILILTILMLMVFIGAAAFAVDIAYIQLVQTQLRSATDSAALAGALALAEGKSAREVRQDVRRLARRNLVAGVGLSLRNTQIQLGRSQPSSGPGSPYVFTSGSSPFNSVRVLGARDANSPDGPVNTFLGRLLGTNSVSPTKSAIATLEERDIVLIVDRSGSMRIRDVTDPDTGQTISRLDALKQAVSLFRSVIDSTPGHEYLALVSYSTYARVEANLSGSYTEFDNKMAAMTASGWTGIGRAIDSGSGAMKHISHRPFATPVFIVMTDGHHNTGVSPITASNSVMNDPDLPKANIHTVTFSPGAGQSLMQQVATIGEGQHLHADTAQDLQASFAELARSAGAVLTQ